MTFAEAESKTCPFKDKTCSTKCMAWVTTLKYESVKKTKKYVQCNSCGVVYKYGTIDLKNTCGYCHEFTLQEKHPTTTVFEEGSYETQEGYCKLTEKPPIKGLI